MRPVNSMIEFKQIVGRGTRLFDGKDYFTVYDYVDAHKHFLDPEWDGEPLDPDPPKPKPPKKPCKDCKQIPCICEKGEGEPCIECGYVICKCGNKTRITRIKLADGKVRELQHMVQTSFWSPDGKPLSAKAFLESMFGVLPEFFNNEEQLRAIWSKPDTRKKLLQDLSEKGISSDQINNLKEMINAIDSDVFDLLAYVAFATNPIKRTKRAEMAQDHFGVYETSQRTFLDFVLKQYVESGVGELDDKKLPELLEMKYHAIADAKRKLGDIASIREMFINFQSHLYED
jgi:type I restriction enzyme, R subunit